METKNREKLLLIGTATVAALWLLDLLVFGPLVDSWHSRSDEIAKLKKEIENGQMLERREAGIRERWDNMRANALANNPTVAERQLFTAFDHWVSSGRVTEGSFRPQVTEGDTNFSTVDCRSDVSGNLATVGDFLKAMSKDPLADKVESFELAAKDDNGQQLTLGLSLSGLILADSDPSSFPAPAVAATPALNANLSANAESDPFRIIARNNIFNQSRTYRDDSPRPRTPTVDTITFHGGAIDNGLGSAWFSGAGVSDERIYKTGDPLSGDLKIAKIINGATVVLTNASGSNFVLSTEGNPSMRREDNGPWRITGYIAAATTTEGNPTASASAAPAPGTGTGASDVLARLMKRRQEEENK
jgi:hypothetical protein